MNDKEYRTILLIAREAIEKKLERYIKILAKKVEKDSTDKWGAGNPSGRGRGRVYSRKIAQESSRDVYYTLIQDNKNLLKAINSELEMCQL